MEAVATVLFPCLMLLCGSPTAWGDHTAQVNSDDSSWQDARQHCQDLRPSSSSSSSCDLSVQDPQQHAGFWKSLQELIAGGTYWVGARNMDRLQWQKSQKQLVEEVGCYVKPDALTTDFRSLRYNDPERCLARCTGSIAAVQDRACYCLSGEQTTSLEQRPLEECHVNCNRGSYRCGGENSRISVYKIPDRTVFEKNGKKTAYFWRRTENNEHEFILLTNTPGKEKKQLCESPNGVYSIEEVRETCPAGGEVVTFEDREVSGFLQATSALNMNWRALSFPLPLTYTKQMLWLNGEAAEGARGKGPCLAITYDGQRLSLVKKNCKTKLPSVCSCYTQSQATANTTEETTVTTTVPPTTTTTTTTTEMTMTTTQVPTTTTTTATEMMKKTPETTTMTSTPGTTTVMTVTTTMTETTATTETSTAETTTTMTTTGVPENTPVYKDGSVSSTASENTTTSLPSTSVTSTSEKSSATSVSSLKGAELQPDQDSKLLFPFSDMKEKSDGSFRAAPPQAPDESTADEGDSTAEATTSIGLIVGTAVAVVALVILVIIVVIVVMRKRKKSSASLLKSKKSAASTSYPI